MFTFIDTLQTQQKLIVILACFKYSDNVYIEPESNTKKIKIYTKVYFKLYNKGCKKKE